MGIEIARRESGDAAAPNSMQKSSFYAETRVEEEERDGGGPTIGLADSGKIHRCLLDVSVSGQFFNSFIGAICCDPRSGIDKYSPTNERKNRVFFTRFFLEFGVNI